MSDYIGNKAIDLTTSPAYSPISKVVLVVSEDDEYVAGDDTGRTIEVSCPWGTQAMANNILSSLQGYIYHPVDVDTAFEADPLWELGDSISVNGITSVLASRDVDFSKAYTENISAPNGEELEHEYPYTSQTDNTIKRAIARTTASLKVEMDNIEGIVSGLAPEYVAGTQYALNDIVYYNKKYYKCLVTTSSTTWVDAEWSEQENGAMSSIIKQTLSSIELTATAGENHSTIKITANGIVMDTAVVTFSNIVADSVVANSSITAPSIYGGKMYSSDGNVSISMSRSGAEGSLLVTNEYKSAPMMQVKTTVFSSADSTLYLAGIPALFASNHTERVNLTNAHYIETAEGKLIITTTNGRYWEISGSGMYYYDEDGTILNYVQLAM